MRCVSLIKSRQKKIINFQLALPEMFPDMSPKKVRLSKVAYQLLTSKKTVENEIIP